MVIQFKGERCRFTLAEAAAGLVIPYQVLVQSAWEGVIPQPQDAGGCDQPGPAGLIPFERLSGGDHLHTGTVVGKLEGDREATLGWIDLLREKNFDRVVDQIASADRVISW